MGEWGERWRSAPDLFITALTDEHARNNGGDAREWQQLPGYLKIDGKIVVKITGK
jgi:hypothetical protein